MYFKIPIQFSDLESTPHDSNQFSIFDVDVNSNLPNMPLYLIHDYIKEYNSISDINMLENNDFVVFVYTFLKYWDEFQDEDTKLLFINMMLHSLNSIETFIERHGANVVRDEDLQNNVLNSLKMIVYFIFVLHGKLNGEDLKQTSQSKSGSKSGGKNSTNPATKGASKNVNINFSFVTKREDVLLQLRELITSHWLVIQACFGNCIDVSLTDTLFKIGFILIGTPQKGVIHSLKNSIFLYCKTIAQICSSFSEYLGNYLFNRIIENDNYSTIFPELLAELRGSDGTSFHGSFVTDFVISCVEYESIMNGNAVSDSARNFATFLEKCALHCPELFMSNIQLLQKNHLDSECFVVRSSTLELLKCICTKVLMQKNDDVSKNIRIAIFENLSERLLDINVYTRSKALQCWKDLLLSNVIPLDILLHVIDMVIMRVEDKTTNVRQHAVKFLLKTMKMHKNLFVPTIPTLTRDLFQKRYETIASKLESETSEVVDALKMEMNICLKAFQYIEKMEVARDKIYPMLDGISTLDVQAAISFATYASDFQLDLKFEGIKAYLKLIWSSIDSVSKSVVKYFSKRFLREMHDEQSSLRIATTLLNFVQACSEEDLISLRKIVQRCVYNDKWDEKLTIILLAILQMKYEKLSNPCVKASQAALVLGMVFSANPELSHTYNQLFYSTLKNHYRELGIGSIELFNAMKYLRKQGEAATMDKNSKWMILTQRVLMHEGTKMGDSIALLQKGIQFIYHMCSEPENVITPLYRHFLSAFKYDKQDWQSLSKLIFLVGEAAFNELIYLNYCRDVELADLRKSYKENEEALKSSKEELEKDFGIIQEEVDTANIEEKYQVHRSSMLQDKWWISSLLPLIEASSSTSITVSFVRVIASTCQAKLCIVSREYCKQNLLRIASLMVNPTTPIIMRTNLIAVMSDIICAHPNEAEGYVQFLYQCVNDISPEVRKHAILVITHLVLNGMIMVTSTSARVSQDNSEFIDSTVSSNISCIARRITDADPFISQAAKSFFFHLQSKLGSDKYHPIYNHTPECISSLSSLSESEFSFEEFQIIIQFFISLIQKESLLKNLTDILANRFAIVNTLDPSRERKWKFIAFTLSSIKLQKSSFTALMEKFNIYKHVLLESKEITEIFADLIRCQKRQIANSQDVAYKDQVFKFEEKVHSILQQFIQEGDVEEDNVEKVEDEVKEENEESMENEVEVEGDQEPAEKSEANKETMDSEYDTIDHEATNKSKDSQNKCNVSERKRKRSEKEATPRKRRLRLQRKNESDIESKTNLNTEIQSNYDAEQTINEAKLRHNSRFNKKDNGSSDTEKMEDTMSESSEENLLRDKMPQSRNFEIGNRSILDEEDESDEYSGSEED